MRKLLLAFVLAAVVLPSCHCSPDEEMRSGTFAADPRVGGLLGVAQYQMTLSRQAGAVVELVGGDGASRGRLVMSASTENDASWSYRAPDGQVAVLRTLQVHGLEGGSWNRFRLEAEGTALELEMTADAELNPLSIALATQGEQPSQDGTLKRRPDGFNQVLELPVGASVAEAEVIAWLEGAGIQPLLESRAAVSLAILALDAELLRGLAQLAGDEDAQGTNGALVQAIHKTTLCSSTLATVSAYLVSKLPSCGVCAGSIAASWEIGGLAAVLAVSECRTCALAVGTVTLGVLACTIATEVAKSDAVCQAESPCEKGYDSKVNSSEHRCLCVCNEQSCEKKYRDTLRLGEVLCSAGCGGGNVCSGDVGVCGDGIRQNWGQCKEQCDYRAMPSGCASGQRCDEQCQCVADTPDAGVDSGVPDAGEPDAGVDSGEPDAGDADAGTVDAGIGVECGQGSFCNPGEICMNCGAGIYCAAPGSICCACNCTSGNYVCPPQSTCVSSNSCLLDGRVVSYSRGDCPCGDF